MIKKAKELFFKYEEIIVYLIVGVMTTIFAWGCMWGVTFLICEDPLYPTATQNFILSVVNWTAGVAFAYPTNRKFVFKSTDPNILAECSKFVVSRISTLVLDIGLRQVLGWIGLNNIAITLISAVAVIIGNYVFSKLMVFKKK